MNLICIRMHFSPVSIISPSSNRSRKRCAILHGENLPPSHGFPTKKAFPRARPVCRNLTCLTTVHKQKACLVRRKAEIFPNPLIQQWYIRLSLSLLKEEKRNWKRGMNCESQRWWWYWWCYKRSKSMDMVRNRRRLGTALGRDYGGGTSACADGSIFLQLGPFVTLCGVGWPACPGCCPCAAAAAAAAMLRRAAACCIAASLETDLSIRIRYLMAASA